MALLCAMIRLPHERHRYREDGIRCIRPKLTVARLLLLLVVTYGAQCQDQEVTAHNHPISETLGSNVTLICCPHDPRPVDWHFRHPGSMTITVCAMGHVAQGLRYKLFLDTSDPGCYNLVVYNLENIDDRFYRCIENGGLGRTTITYQVETDSSLSLAGDQSTSTTLNSTCIPTDKEVCQHRTRGLLICLIVASAAGVLVVILGLILIYGVCRHRNKRTCENPKDALKDEQHEFVKRPVTANGVNSAAEKPNGQIVRFTTPATDVHSEPV